LLEQLLSQPPAFGTLALRDPLDVIRITTFNVRFPKYLMNQSLLVGSSGSADVNVVWVAAISHPPSIAMKTCVKIPRRGGIEVPSQPILPSTCRRASRPSTAAEAFEFRSGRLFFSSTQGIPATNLLELWMEPLMRR
jgi:hypothetical protein